LQASAVLDNIRTLLEWCSEACLKQNDEKRDNPFSFKRLNICTSVAALDTLAMSSLSLGQTQPRPMLVVASTDDLSQSLAAELAQRWLPDPNSLLLFTNRVRPQSVAGRLMTVPKPSEVVIETKYNEALTGAELRAEMRKRELERAGPRKVDTEAAEADSEEEDEEDYDAFSTETSANSNTQTAVSAPAGVVSASSPGVIAGSAIVLLPARFGAATAFPTFPSFEDKWITDAFGEQIRPELYTLAVAESEGLVALPKAKSEVTPAVDDTPVSVHSKSIAVPVRCEVLFVDCEGRSDGKGLKSIFKNLKPKTLILIHGNDDDKEHLKQYCGEQIPNCKNIFVPLKGQTLDITADLSVFSIKLKESMEQLLRWQDMPGDYQVAWVDGEIRFEGGLPTLAPPREAQAGNALTMSALSAQFAELMPVESSEEMDIDATLPTLIDDEEMSDVSQIVDFGDCDMAPAGLARAAHTIMSSGDHGRGAHAQLLLGDIKLANCRTALNQEAISVNNPNAGTLVCAANAVVVRKHMAQLTVTGALGEDYYRVRDVLYSQFERI
jgi:cleavage and polyadenylation specificity factor subunit 2